MKSPKLDSSKSNWPKQTTQCRRVLERVGGVFVLNGTFFTVREKEKGFDLTLRKQVSAVVEEQGYF